jgi:alcohol dehydrogenase
MRAVVYAGPRSVHVADVPEPRLEEPGDALVDVTTSAVCGSDLHCYRGKIPLQPGDPMGHEAVGVVREVGERVRSVRPGQRVVMAFSNVCGECWYCRNGQTSLCERFRNLGFGKFSGGLGGLQAEMARIPGADVNLLPVPHGVKDEAALFVGDVLTTAWYGVSLAGVKAGEAVAVLGAGPLGFLVVQCARLAGARQVIALDLLPDRLALAERAGAVGVDVSAADPKAAVRDLTDGRGADVTVEAVGTLDAFRTAVAVTRRGGRVEALGVVGNDTLDLDLAAYWYRGLTLLFAGICPVQAYWRDAMRALVEGRVDPLPLISHRLLLDEASEAYELFDRREATKVLLMGRDVGIATP